MAKKEKDSFIRVERHIISEKDKLYKQLDELCFLSKNLYNYANYQIRQTFIICSKLSKNEIISKEQEGFLNNINLEVDKFNKNKLENYIKNKEKAITQGKEFKKKFVEQKYFNKDNKYLNYNFLEFLIKNGNDYKALMAQVSQQTLKLLDKNWLSFFESNKKYNSDKTNFLGRPKLPKYLKKDGRSITIFTNQNCKLKDNKVQFPNCLEKYLLKTNVKNLQQVRILPRNKHFIIEVVYQNKEIELLEDNKKYYSIDIGIDNFATITNNFGENPIVINGKGLKSINQYYNKKLSYYKSISKRMNKLDYTNKQNKLTIKRNNKVIDFIHKASKKIIDLAIENNVTKIVVGNNKNWKQNSKMSKKVNQNFIQIPFTEFINKLVYKALDVGIEVKITEESYTSKASFIDNDEIPVYNKNNTKKYEFSGKRIKRGLYKSKNGILINADVNGSYNIMKKVFPKAYSNGIEGVGFHPIVVNII